MRTRVTMASMAFCALLATAASAQSPRQEGQVRVQSSVNFFLLGPTNESEEAQKLRDRAKRMIYDIAGRECDVLRDVLAKDCRLESVNTNISSQRGQQQPEGYSVNGQMSLVIMLK